MDVPVVANRQQRLEGVLHHAGHRHGNQTVGLVVFKDVAPLAMQQEHNGLQRHRTMDMSREESDVFMHFVWMSVFVSHDAAPALASCTYMFRRMKEKTATVILFTAYYSIRPLHCPADLPNGIAGKQ